MSLPTDSSVISPCLCSRIRSVNPDVAVQSTIFPLSPRRQPYLSFPSPSASYAFHFLFPSRWRGALHHAGHPDDDGLLVDVRPDCHLLVHGQPRSLPHHHTHRELHTVSVQLILLFDPVWRALNCGTSRSLNVYNYNACNLGFGAILMCAILKTSSMNNFSVLSFISFPTSLDYSSWTPHPSCKKSYYTCNKTSHHMMPLHLK